MISTSAQRGVAQKEGVLQFKETAVSNHEQENIQKTQARPQERAFQEYSVANEQQKGDRNLVKGGET